jgi:hypothetical protein
MPYLIFDSASLGSSLEQQLDCQFLFQRSSGCETFGQLSIGLLIFEDGPANSDILIVQLDLVVAVEEIVSTFVFDC